MITSMSQTNYDEVIERMTRRRDYFSGMEFYQIASDYTTLLSVIESLRSELKDAQDKLANVEKCANNEEENNDAGL